jgi:hypothetical protein
MPTFNIDGIQKVSSCVGLALSLLLYVVLIGIAASRAVVLFGDGNPILSTYTTESEYELDHSINLNDFGFNVAFKVERINVDETVTAVNDPDFVDFVVVIDETRANGTKSQTPVGHHKCNTTDYETFYEAGKG